jgi:hypothetical protein
VCHRARRSLPRPAQLHDRGRRGVPVPDARLGRPALNGTNPARLDRRSESALALATGRALPEVDPCITLGRPDLDARRVRRNDSALRLLVQTDVVSEIARLRVSIAREAAAVDKTLNDHPSASDDEYSRWGCVEYHELIRQLDALHERVARAPSRSRDRRELRAEFATLLCFAETLRTDAETWRAGSDHRLKELERNEAAAREERERLAAEREALMRRRDALQCAVDETAGRIAQKNGGDCRNTLPVFRLSEALTVCSVVVLSSRKRFRSQPSWLVTLNDSCDQVRVRRSC